MRGWGPFLRAEVQAGEDEEEGFGGEDVVEG